MNQPLVSKPIHRAIKYRAYPSATIKKELEHHFTVCQKIFNSLLLANEENNRKNHCDLEPRIIASMAAAEGKKYPGINRQVAYFVAPRIIYGLAKAKKQGEGALHPKKIGETEASFTIRCTKPVFKPLSSGSKKRCLFSIPVIGEITITNHRDIPENVVCRLCTVSRNAAGQFFVSIEYDFYLPAKPPTKIRNPLGLDFSVPKLYVASDRNLVPDIEMLKIRKEFASKVASAHRQLSRCQKGSKNYEKARKKLAKIYQKMDNIRLDFIHKETTRIAENYDFVSVETLSLTDMCERFHFYKAVYDNSWYIFVATLKYKMEKKQKQFRFVSRFYPSSKTCHRCGYINHRLTLADRIYDCPVCHLRADRDVNASKNIRDQALRDAGYVLHYVRPKELPKNDDKKRAPQETKKDAFPSKTMKNAANNQKKATSSIAPSAKPSS